MTDISTRIKIARKRISITQKQLADRTNVSMDSVRRWESGLRTPKTGATLDALADALKTTGAYLIGETDDPSPHLNPNKEQHIDVTDAHMTVGKNVRDLRKQMDLNQEELAKRVGVSLDTVSRWESGKRTPRIVDVIQLATALNTTVAYITGETNDPTPMRMGKRTDEDVCHDTVHDFYRLLPGGLIGVGANIALVPKVSEQYCGGAGYATYQDTNESCEYEPIVCTLLGVIDEAKPPRAYKVDGNSMVDYGVPSDSWVVVNPSQQVTSGAVCLVEIGGNPVIKKIYPRPDGGFELHASNGQTIRASKDDIESEYIRIIGKVVGIQGTVDHRP